MLRIALPFALLLALTLGLLGLYLSNFIQESYLEILRGNLQAETRLVADRMALIIQPAPDPAAVEERAKLYAGLLGVRVTIIDPTGKVLGESSTNPLEMENHLSRPEVQRALQRVTSTEIRYSSTLRTEMLYAAAPIVDNGKLIGIARLAVSLDMIHRKESGMLNAVLIATTIATILAILLAVFIATYTVRPIVELTSTARQVAEGELDEIAADFR